MKKIYDDMDIVSEDDPNFENFEGSAKVVRGVYGAIYCYRETCREERFRRCNQLLMPSPIGISTVPKEMS
jgi:hypothetical protein